MKDFTRDTLTTAVSVGYIKDGELIVGQAAAANILVSDESDLDLIVDLEPGTLAHTPGYAEIWELDTEGNWVEIE